jgi:hypothetical protein
MLSVQFGRRAKEMGYFRIGADFWVFVLYTIFFDILLWRELGYVWLVSGLLAPSHTQTVDF